MRVNEMFVEDNYKLIQYMVHKVATDLSIEDKEDLVNDVVVKILEANMHDDYPSGYIKTVVTNAYLNYIRDNNTDALNHATSLDAPLDEEDKDSGTLHDIVPDKDVSAYAAKHHKSFMKLCKTLPMMQSKMMYKRYILGQTPAEIAAELEIPNITVRVTLQRAKENLFKEK